MLFCFLPLFYLYSLFHIYFQWYSFGELSFGFYLDLLHACNDDNTREKVMLSHKISLENFLSHDWKAHTYGKTLPKYRSLRLFSKVGKNFSFSPYWTSIAVELRRKMFLVYSFYCNLSVINC